MIAIFALALSNSPPIDKMVQQLVTAAANCEL